MPRKICAFFVLILFTGNVFAAEQPPSAPYDLYNTCLFCKTYLRTLGIDTKHIVLFPTYWTGKQWLEFGALAGGIAALTKADIPIQREIQPRRNEVTDQAASFFNPFGIWYAYGTMGIFYIGGQIFHSHKMQVVGLDALTASLISHGIFVRTLKMSFGRARPFKHEGAYHFSPFSSDDSFPSGHTNQAFAVATVVSSYYHPLWARIAAYGIATVVGLARMDNDLHFTSDVVAGAVLGTVIGREVVRFNRKMRAEQFETSNARQSHFLFFPAIGSKSVSLQVVIH